MRRADVGGVALSAAVAALVAAAAFFGHGSSDARLFWLGAAALFLTGVGWILRPAVLSREGVAFCAFYDGYAGFARLRWPLEYWNELALLAAGAVPLALWLAAQRRVAGSLLLYAAFVTDVLTFSRFGIALAVVAAVAWLVIERDR